MSEDGLGSEAETIVSLLDDEYARTILAATSIEPMSVSELVDRCDASDPTIYRRIERLREQDLLVERQIPDPDGHHYKRYAARLDHVSVDLDDGEFDVQITRRDEEDAVDRFTRLVEGFR